jgi:hypothetical protein
MPTELHRPDPDPDPEEGLNPNANALSTVPSSSPPGVDVSPTEAGVADSDNDVDIDIDVENVGQDPPHQDEEQPRRHHHHHHHHDADEPDASTSSITTDGDVGDAAGVGTTLGMEIIVDERNNNNDDGACRSSLFATMDTIGEIKDRAKDKMVFFAVSRHVQEDEARGGENDEVQIISSTNPTVENNIAVIDIDAASSHPLPPPIPIREDTVGNVIVASPEHQEEPRRTLIIHDAFLVTDILDNDDGVVIDATPVESELPWWKVKRIQLCLCGLLLFAVANATAIGLLLSSGNNENNEPTMTSATASANSLSLKSHPPTMSPEACADKVSANAQNVEILGLADPKVSTISVDGRNMVMAVRDSTTSQQVVIFYLLPKNETVWHEVKSFHIDNVGSAEASVALSGKTAIVGFGEANNYAGVVMVFERNQFGDWEEMNPFIHATNTTTDDVEHRYGFGLHHVDIDGNFACVVDYNNCAHSSSTLNGCNHNVNVFRRTMGYRWVEVDVISGQDCRIAGNTLVVLEYEMYSDNSWMLQLYAFNETAYGFVPSQDPIVVYAEVLSMELSQNTFVFWDPFQQGATIYQRRNESEPYSLVEQISVNAPPENQIALDNDVLIVGGGGDDQTYVFSYRNGNWAESFTLEQKYGHFKCYQLSAWTLLAITSEMNIYSFNIEECTQRMPTLPQSSASMETSMSPQTSVSPPTTLSSSPSWSSSASSSYSPTACVNKILSKSQRIETYLHNATYLAVALDGVTAVLVVKDGNGQVMVMFYNWTNNGGWKLGEDFNLGYLTILNEALAASISDNAAFVGVPEAYSKRGAVVVFHRSQAGKWEKQSEPFIPNPHKLEPSYRLLGYGIDIKGNLSIVAIDDYLERNKLVLYQREGTQWVLIEIFNGRCPCSITGNVIVSVKLDRWFNEVLQLYKYNADDRSIVPLQRSIPSGNVQHVDSSNDYIIYWDAAASWKDGISSGEEASHDYLMYRRDEGNQTLTFLRRFDILGANGALSMNDDILILSGNVFLLRNGEWIETFTLNRRFDEYKLSGRLVLARTYDEVVSFSIDDCTQEMPTQVPSLSLSPSHIPSMSHPTARPSSSIVPSLSPSPTDHPSTSITPTFTSFPTVNCDWIVIHIEYDDFSSEVSWKLFSIDESEVVVDDDDDDDDDGGGWVVRSHATIEWIPSYLESICLPVGMYKFVIYDSAHDGICCKYDTTSFYSLSLKNGELIRSGGEFEWSESTIFSIPFNS